MPDDLKKRLEIEAQQSGCSISALVREAVAARLRAEESPTTLYDRTRDLCGAGASGKPDLATSPEHMTEFGE